MPFDSVNKKTHVNTKGPKYGSVIKAQGKTGTYYSDRQSRSVGTPNNQNPTAVSDTATLNKKIEPASSAIRFKPSTQSFLQDYNSRQAPVGLKPPLTAEEKIEELKRQREEDRNYFVGELEKVKLQSQGQNLVTPGAYENAAQRTGRAMQSASQDAYGRVDPSAQRAAMYGQAGLRQNMAMDAELGRLNEMENARQLYGRGLKTLNEYDLEGAIFANDRWKSLSDEELATAIANDVINRNKSSLELDNIKHAYDQYSTMVENNLMYEQADKYKQMQNQINGGGNAFGSTLEGIGAAAPIIKGLWDEYGDEGDLGYDDFSDLDM